MMQRKSRRRLKLLAVLLKLNNFNSIVLKRFLQDHWDRYVPVVCLLLVRRARRGPA